MHREDAIIMNVYEELESLSKDCKNEILIKSYLLGCCKKYERFRSKGTLTKGVVIAKRFLKGYAKWKELHDIEWFLEGEAFGLEFYGMGETSYWPKLSKYDRADLINVRLSCCLTHRESVAYLTNLAYFIDSVIGYVGYSANGVPPKKYAKFMCPVLFKKHFRK
jgi:hypothetical protein